MPKSNYYFMKNNKDSNKILKTKKVRIFPTKNQIAYFEECFGITRFVWNMCITEFIEKNKEFKEYDFKKYLNSLAKTKEYDFFNNVNSMVRQETIKSFKMSLNNYKSYQKYLFNKYKDNLDIIDLNKKRPSKKDKCQWFRYNNKGIPLIPNGKKHFYLTTCSRIGGYHGNSRMNIKCSESLLFLGKRKDSNHYTSNSVRFIQVTILKDYLNHYYACIDYEILPEKANQIRENHIFKYDKIGIDMGIKNPYTCYYEDNKGRGIIEIYDIPESLKTYHKRLDYIQSKVTKKFNPNKDKYHQSNNYYKLLNKRNKIIRKIVNIKDNDIKQFVSYLCKNFKTIIYEDFPCNYTNDGFKYDHHRLKDIARYKFLEQLHFKAKYYGNEIIRVENGTPTTQTCSCCGNRLYNDDKLTLDDREYHCHKCGMTMDRDENSAINIYNYKYDKNDIFSIYNFI